MFLKYINSSYFRINSAVAGEFGLNLNALDDNLSAGMIVFVMTDNFKR